MMHDDEEVEGADDEQTEGDEEVDEEFGGEEGPADTE